MRRVERDRCIGYTRIYKTSFFIYLFFLSSTQCFACHILVQLQFFIFNVYSHCQLFLFTSQFLVQKGGEGGGERMNRGFTRIAESTSDTHYIHILAERGTYREITSRSKNLQRSVCLIYSQIYVCVERGKRERERRRESQGTVYCLTLF